YLDKGTFFEKAGVLAPLYIFLKANFWLSQCFDLIFEKLILYQLQFFIASSLRRNPFIGNAAI
ncbi:hypothetical protein, partial [Ferruginibacter sp.]|uniref:hypothetical protein n=1 Tax=Ferruginibacter sp. TaxID=1940288 RepID=UPI00374C9F45